MCYLCKQIVLYYIDRCKARQDGYTVILCRITVDGASTVMATGEECTPEEWNVKQSETSNRKLNLRLQIFKEKIERAYVETLRRDGVISAELLKNHLQRINSVPAMLLEASRTELQSIEACIGKSKSKSTYRNNFYCDKKLSHFVSNKSKIDVPISILSIAFFDEYRFHLKKEGYASATINTHLCWLSRLMYKAVSRWMIRFNPLFFRNLISPRLLAFPCSIRRRNSAGGCFFSRSLQAWLLSTAKFAHLAHQDERRRETLYPENKIENGRGKSYSLASDSGTDSCALYEK